MQDSNARAVITDWEGPFGKNDYAMELTAYFVPNGANLYTLLSKYDDIVAEVLKRPNYGAGDTLKLILPFLRAYGATNSKIEQYAKNNTRLLSGSIETLRYVKSIMPLYVISASYDICLNHIWRLLGLPKENVYSTPLDIDKYESNDRELRRLKQIALDIGNLANKRIERIREGGALIEIPESAEKVEDFQKEERRVIEKLDDFFWEEIYQMEAGRMIKETKIVDSLGKAGAISEIVKKSDMSMRDFMYLGDSITDVSAFRTIRENGGVTISFNGNDYAIREAEIAVLSENAMITSIFADVFNFCGNEGLRKLIEEWSLDAIEKHTSSNLRGDVLNLLAKKLPRVELISQDNIEKLIEESTRFRKLLRGEMIGALG